MKKYFTLLLLCALIPIGMKAQDVVTEPASYSFEENGTTLTIKGAGDLTEYSSTELNFTTEGRTDIKIENNENGSGVGDNDIYDSNQKYYSKRCVEVTDLYQGGNGKGYVTAETASYSWSEKGLSLYHTTDNGTTWTMVESTNATVDMGTGWFNGVEYSNYSTTNNSEKRLKWSDFVTGGYYTVTLTNVSFINWKVTSLYVLEYDKYIQLTTDAEYNPNVTYYELQFGEISETEMKRMGYIAEYSVSFAEILSRKIAEESFETVKFVNEGTSSLFINDDIVRSVTFPNSSVNTNLATLDLGEAMVEELSAETFQIGLEHRDDIANMTNLVLPLTKLSKVTSETISGETEPKDKMIVPSNILQNYKNNCKLKSVTIPKGYDWIGEKAFYDNNTITTVNFPSSLTLIGKSAFEGCNALTGVSLNEGLENIGKTAFARTGLTEIVFPTTLRIINDGAFYGLSIKELKFNPKLYFIGMGAFGLDNALTVDALEIPASVRYIGPGAFRNRRYKDVFFYGKEAPMMPLGTMMVTMETGTVTEANVTAFSENTLNGNNGFEKGKDHIPTKEKMYDDTTRGYANRENYRGSDKAYFGMLHYPKDLDDDARAKYTDITRIYETHRYKDDESHKNTDYFYADGTYDVGKEEETLAWGTVTLVGKSVTWGFEDTYLGTQYVWPSQTQWNRAYAVVSNGYNWDGVTKYRPALSTTEKATLKYAGFVLNTDGGEYTEDELQKIAYMGTRQFVFTYADVNGKGQNEEDNPYPLFMKGGNWWTICVPFDMTKAEVDKVFGEGTHVCRFSGVDRKDDGENKSIVLKFQNDVYAIKWERNPETLEYKKTEFAPDDNDIVIYSHEAYMIRPTKSDDDATDMIDIESYDFVPGSPYPTFITANADDKSDGADHTEYRFVGNYLTKVYAADETPTMNIPKYSYVYAKKKDTPYKFWFLTGEDTPWSANKCVVQATARDRSLDYKNFFGSNPSNSKIAQNSLFGADDSVTEIENVTIIAGEGRNEQIVYSLDGKVVSNNNSLEGLSRGIYIRGGKKYVVR